MAGKRGWKRYRPPSERRDERGRPIDVGASKPDRSPRPADPGRPAKADRRKAARSTPAVTTSKSSRAGLLIALVILAVVIGIVAIARSANDDDVSSGIDRELLDVDFVADSIELAIEEEGKQAVSLQLTEYGLTVEYFDPNERESRYFETNSYTDGYELRVERTRYENYQPVPFDLTALSPQRIVQTVEDALDSTEDPYTFSLRAAADRETDEVVLEIRISGEETVELTQAP